MLDVPLMRLQYEILNVSIDSLAESTGIPAEVIGDEVIKKGWTRQWPDDDEPQLLIEPGEDTFKLQSDAYIEKTRKRLHAYSLAKEVLLATRYLELEAGIISKANECLMHIDPSSGTAAVKALSSLWKDMQKSAAQAAAFSISQDEGGLPTVIIKDLSGRPI